VSANYHHDALHPEVATSLDEGLAPGGFLAKPYEALSPDGPEHWPVVAAKGTRMGVFEEPTFTPHDLTGIAVPTLVMSGDDDMFPASHTVSLYEALPNARLAIVPNASHLLVLEHPALVAEIITAFLQSPNRQPTFLPYRRPPIGA
jgi:pimeloyl-ACP methyl ester carboxylesterase